METKVSAILALCTVHNTYMQLIFENKRTSEQFQTRLRKQRYLSNRQNIVTN